MRLLQTPFIIFDCYFHINIMKSLHQIILQARLSKGLKQSYMATRLKVSRKTYCYIEAGKTSPRANQLKVIINELDISPLIIYQYFTGRECRLNCQYIQ